MGIIRRMSKKQKNKQKRALNSDKVAQRIAELKKSLRKPHVRTSQKHRNKRNDPKIRRRDGKRVSE